MTRSRDDPITNQTVGGERGDDYRATRHDEYTDTRA
jgi:hypothetical protein